jgi:eukaryotic-like serine/threonine-protein kinase
MQALCVRCAKCYCSSYALSIFFVTDASDLSSIDNPQSVLAWFDRYLATPAAERGAFIERELAGDPALRAEVEALARADHAATQVDFLARAAHAREDRTGEVIDAWTLVRWIGSGGAGVVYEARRNDDPDAAPVALKLLTINVGNLRARFIRERQILGALAHPYIAGLLDAGADARGAPYMVLEYVRGAPITQHAITHAMPLAARLRLFGKVLDAVQGAHMHLVVHRDLKPSNIFVDEMGDPKLLDFGIAKMLDEAEPGLTRQGSYAMTPEYASPEQVRGDAITTATDIYSLGVLLYELVSGSKPYTLEDVRPGTLERVICQTDPPRPSSKTVSGEVPRRARDLDAIVLRAMAKSPKDRYVSCAALKDDIERWLDGRPVLARSTPWTDRVLLFARRHTLGLSVTTATVAALCVGAAAFVWQARETTHARERADRVNKFLLETLAAANPAELGKDATVAQVMARAMETASKSMQSDPRAASEIWMTLAGTYESLADFANARVCAENALRFAQATGDGELIARGELSLGGVLVNQREPARAKALLESARARAMATRDPQLQANAANRLGLMYSALGKEREALGWYRTALEDGPKDDLGDQAVGYANVAIKQCKMGDCAAGVESQKKAVDLLRRAHVKPHPNLALGLSNLGGMLMAQERVTEAVPHFEQGLAMQVQLLGEAHPDAVYSLATLAKAYARVPRMDDALQRGAQAYALAEQLPKDEVTRTDVGLVYAEILTDAKQFASAQGVAEATHALLRSQSEPDAQALASAESVLGYAIAAAGDRIRGESLAQRATEALVTQLGEQHLVARAARSRLERIRSSRY